MRFAKSLAGWMMAMAARCAPADRAEWAMAMRGEFDTLASGELSWASGCLMASVRWKLHDQRVYAALLLAAPLLVQALGYFELGLMKMQVVPPWIFQNYGAVLGMLFPLPLAVMLGAYRPNSVAKTIFVGCVVVQHGCGTLISYLLGLGSFLSWWGPRFELYMAPLPLGLSASIGIWYLGTTAGAAWSRSFPGLSVSREERATILR